MTTLAFLGAGSMGGSIVRGLLASGTAVENVRATTGSEASAAALREELGITAEALETRPEANAEAAASADVVVLGVKPAKVRETLEGIAGSLGPGTVVASVAAGVSLATLQELAGEAAAVRLMPNTPVAIGEGVISLTAADADAGRRAAALVSEVLTPVARVVPLAEDQIPATVGISGSGTAYFFYLAQALLEAGVELGLTREQAKEIVAGTARGAGLLLETTGEEPEALLKKIVSPGGTTAAALAEFDAGRADAIIRAAAHAAAKKNRAMEAELG